MQLFFALAAVALLLNTPAWADLAAAEEALSRGDVAAAMRSLEASELRYDSNAMRLRARILDEGLSGPPDPVGAYAWLTQASLHGTDEEGREAIRDRRKLSRRMQLPQIVAAEAQFVAMINERLSPAIVDMFRDMLLRALQGCSTDCAAALKEVWVLGPAAAPAVPAIEALMTRDPLWVPRSDYADALFTIGTAAVPALCRLIEDEAELRRKGPTNLILAASALSALAGAGREGLFCLLGAVERDTRGLIGRSTYMTLPGKNVDEVTQQVRLHLLLAIAGIGDPEGVTYDRLIARLATERDLFIASAITGVVGLIHDEPEHALALAPRVLRSGKANEKAIMLAALGDLAEVHDLRAQARPLMGSIRSLAAPDQDPMVSDAAQRLLGLLVP